MNLYKLCVKLDLKKYVFITCLVLYCASTEYDITGLVAANRLTLAYVS